MKRDAGRGRIDFVDIAAPEYTAADNYGISYQQVGPLSVLPRPSSVAESRFATGLPSLASPHTPPPKGDGADPRRREQRAHRHRHRGVQEAVRGRG